MTHTDQSPELINEEDKKRIINEIKKEISRIRNYTPKIGIFGDSGVGKSSLCNVLFGKEIAKISNVEACTREPQKILIRNDGSSGGIILIDVPGIGEDPKRHEEYRELYKSLLPKLDLVIWAIKSDDRKYATSIDVYEDVLKPNLEKCPVVFAITQADKIEPNREWNTKENKPGDAQDANLQKKINDVSNKFNISTKYIVPVSASDAWNLVQLMSVVVEALPKDIKYSVTREAKQENVSSETAAAAEEGIWDSIKEKVGDVWDFVKYEAADLLVETVKNLAPTVISILKDKLSKKENLLKISLKNIFK